MKSEADVKKAVKTVLKKYGGKIHYWMPQSGAYGCAGVHDIIVCFYGMFVTVETKKPAIGPKGLSALQRRFSTNICRARGISFVVWDNYSLLLFSAFLEDIHRNLGVLHQQERPWEFAIELYNKKYASIRI